MSTIKISSVEGIAVSESDAGAIRDYLFDGNGSVAGYCDEHGSVVNQYWFKPFGDRLNVIGTGGDPNFLWRSQDNLLALQSLITSCVLGGRYYDVTSARWLSLIRRHSVFGRYYMGPSSARIQNLATSISAVAVYPEAWTVSTCGGYLTFIRWQNVPNQQGYLIQRLDYRIKHWNCGGTLVRKQGGTFYEAWGVSDDVSGTPLLYDCHGDDDVDDAPSPGKPYFDDSWTGADYVCSKEETWTSYIMFLPSKGKRLDSSWKCGANNYNLWTHDSTFTGFRGQSRRVQSLYINTNCCACSGSVQWQRFPDGKWDLSDPCAQLNSQYMGKCPLPASSTP